MLSFETFLDLKASVILPNDKTGLLLILDGFGVNPDPTANAVALANAPTYQRLLKTYSHTQIQASESFVGLPLGFMGNSEVGHLNIGAGRVVYQDFSLISRAIEDGSFYTNPYLLTVLSEVKKRGATLHLMGLVSDGGVHSHLSHLLALLQLAKKTQIAGVRIHVFTDGRDTAPTSGADFIRHVVAFCQTIGLGQIATVSGRFFAMDRDNRWERTEEAYNAIVRGKAAETFRDPIQAVKQSYANQVTDEFVKVSVAEGYPGMQAGDGAIFFNFRADRARQLTRALTQDEFSFFNRGPKPPLSGFVSLTPYDESFHLPAAYEKAKVPMTLGEVISRLGWKQLRIAETEKYAHVTYFFSGGDEKVFEGEKRVLIPSPREVKTYDLKPEMSARQVTDALLKELDTEAPRFAVVNFANPDMVGHTGDLKAAIRAVEAVDACLKDIVAWVESHNAFAILTADHGNCEKMVSDTGEPFTAHTLLPVPFVVIDPSQHQHALASGGQLSDIAPSMLKLWQIPQPQIMTGRCLILD